MECLLIMYLMTLNLDGMLQITSNRFIEEKSLDYSDKQIIVTSCYLYVWKFEISVLNSAWK